MTLAVALLLLTLLTILALSASQVTKLEEHMAGNARDIDIAFQAAEAGVRNAEDYIASLPPGDPPLCSSAPCKIFQLGVLPSDMGATNDTWWTTHGWEYGTTAKEMTTAVSDPYYVIEQTAYVPDSLNAGEPPSGRYFFRTVSAAKGATNTAVVILETVYTRRLN